MEKIFYIISVMFLIFSYLLFFKSKKKLSVIREFIYSICLFYCYNVLVVHVVYLFKQTGTFFLYGSINIIISIILGVITLITKRKQQYYFKKREFLFFGLFFVLFMLLGYLRFHGGRLIHYESVDASIHYRYALHFSETLSTLTKENSKDLVYGNFERGMSISYVNGGFLIRILSFIKSYRVFLLHDTISFAITGLIFLSTLFQLFKKRNYFYYACLMFLYSFSFLLNSYIFGFSYLTLGMMVVNLLLLTVLSYEKEWEENIWFKILILFILSFSVFFSYYLFFPCIYLALGIYYIKLYQDKEISFKQMSFYGIFTLILPFFIGFFYFVFPTFFKVTGGVATAVSSDGYIYNNKTPSYFFAFFFFYLVYFERKFQKENTYLVLNFYFISFYIVLFFVLFIFHLSGEYYFHKLFYLYSIFVILYFGIKLENKKKYVYLFTFLTLGSMLLIRIMDDNKLTNLLSKLNVYNWNSYSFNQNRTLIDEDELILIEESTKYKDVCSYHHEFINIGKKLRNYWFYAITNEIPLAGYHKNNKDVLNQENISLRWFDNFEHPCVVYFYDGNIKDPVMSRYDILYQNQKGAILKKKN